MTGSNIRYDISYDSKAPRITESLSQLGVGITFNNTSTGRIIATIPSSSLERVRGLQGILDVVESPLKAPSTSE